MARVAEFEDVPLGPLVRVTLPCPAEEVAGSVALTIEVEVTVGQADSETSLTVMTMVLVVPVPEMGIQGTVMVRTPLSVADVLLVVDAVSGPATVEEPVTVGKGVGGTNGRDERDDEDWLGVVEVDL